MYKKIFVRTITFLRDKTHWDKGTEEKSDCQVCFELFLINKTFWWYFFHKKLRSIKFSHDRAYEGTSGSSKKWVGGVFVCVHCSNCRDERERHRQRGGRRKWSDLMQKVIISSSSSTSLLHTDWHWKTQAKNREYH